MPDDPLVTWDLETDAKAQDLIVVGMLTYGETDRKRKERLKEIAVLLGRAEAKYRNMEGGHVDQVWNALIFSEREQRWHDLLDPLKDEVQEVWWEQLKAEFNPALTEVDGGKGSREVRERGVRRAVSWVGKAKELWKGGR